MATARRGGRKQAKLEDVGVHVVKARSKAKSEASRPRVKKEPKTTSSKTPSRAPSTSPSSSPLKSLKINRAPVLHLWAACVAQQVDSSLPWKSCLSAGSAISTLAAISKGRAIGAIDKADEANSVDKQKEREKRRAKTEKAKTKELRVMTFNLKFNDQGLALLQGEGKNYPEELLVRKYGGEEAYRATKEAFQSSLAAWTGRKDELNRSAFHMYEKFRPNVPPGQAGWGRKGELNLQHIRDVVQP